MEAGDKQSGSKGHGWSVGQVVGIERAWWKEMSSQAQKDMVGV